MSFELPKTNKNGVSVLKYTVDHISIEHFSPQDLFGGDEPSAVVQDLSNIISNYSQPLVVFDKRSLTTDVARYYFDLITSSVDHDIVTQQMILSDDAKNWLILEKAKRVRDNLISAMEIQKLNEALANQVASYKSSGPAFF